MKRIKCLKELKNIYDENISFICLVFKGTFNIGFKF